MSKKLSYDTAFAELNQILNDLQSDDVSIDALSEKLKKASELTEYCKTRLRAIEEEVEKMSPSEKQV
jgi:exodeoxyribonuclease VII small subunit